MSTFNQEQKKFTTNGLQIDTRDFPSVSAVYQFNILAVMFLLFFIGFLQGDLYAYDTSFFGNNDVFIALASITFFSKRPIYLTYFIIWLSLTSACIYDNSIFYKVLLISVSMFFTYESIFDILDLPKTVKSFICIMIVLSMLLVYLFSFFLLYKGLSEPILINDLSEWSKYRYLFLVLGVFFFFIILVLRNYSVSIASIYTFGSFPHIKEEVRVIMHKWYDTTWEPIFISFLGFLKDYTWFRIGYIIIHFLMFFGIRILILFLFIKFIAFGGDLRNILYLLPLSFIAFLLSFVEYYYNWYFKETLLYFQKVLKVKMLSAPIRQSQDILFVNTSQFSFELTAFGEDEGFSKNHIRHLKDLWFEYGRVEASLSLYQKYIGWISLAITIIQIICWLYVVNLFFLAPAITYAVNGGLPFSRRVIFPYFCVRQPLHVRGVHKHLQTKLTAELEGVYSPGHLIILDDCVVNPNEWFVAGELTKGRGTPENPSYPLAPATVTGSNHPQFFIPTVRANTFVSKSYFLPYAVPNSHSYIETYKVNLYKNLPIDENT